MCDSKIPGKDRSPPTGSAWEQKQTGASVAVVLSLVLLLSYFGIIPGL